MTTDAVIVAAGRGIRAGGGIPKQWRMLAGRSVLTHAFEALANLAEIRRIAIVVHKDDMQQATEILGYSGALLVAGGANRDDSVRAGLAALAAYDDWPKNVLIHDGARPNLRPAVTRRVLAALETAAAAAPAIPVSDALWKGEFGHVDGVVPRNALFRAQTPQGFHFEAIYAAHQEQDTPAADDVEVARRAGMDVVIVEGDEANIKITRPEDFALVAPFLKATVDMDIRTGNGYDVHRFGEGDHVWLCGVKVPHTKSLIGHSDADVGMHAITDAIYGALGKGDIGQHFPPSDPQWKGAESHIFLRHACALATEMGYRISNVDCTLVCEQPKIGPHQAAMRGALAEIMQLDESRIGVKATTSEKLGFTGREEGIAALATATLIGKSE